MEPLERISTRSGCDVRILFSLPRGALGFNDITEFSLGVLNFPQVMKWSQITGIGTGKFAVRQGKPQGI